MRPASTSMPPPNLSAGEVRKVAAASLIGTTIEWYDFFIYGVAASLIFSDIFFPSFEGSSGTLVSVATIGVAFVARPVGGIIFGHVGDRIGRKTTLVITLLIAGIATLLIGLLPTYATIGVAAPIVLVLLRFAQGIGLAGEWGGAVLMAAEHAPPNRRGLYAGFPQMGVALGVILANGLFLVMTAAMSEDAFRTWGWRIPFLASVLLIVVGLVIRLRVMESPVFRAMEQSGSRSRSPLLAAVTRNPRQLVVVTLGLVLNLLAFYVLITFMLTYTTSTLGMSRTPVLLSVLVGAALLGVGTLAASRVSDSVGRKPVVLALYAGWLVFAFPMFWLVNSATTVAVALAVGVGMLLTSAYGPIAAFLAELFPPQMRYSGMSIAFQVASVLGGGLAPILAVELAASVGWQAVALMLMGTAVVGVVCIGSLRESKDVDFTAVDDGDASAPGAVGGATASPSATGRANEEPVA